MKCRLSESSRRLAPSKKLSPTIGVSVFCTVALAIGVVASAQAPAVESNLQETVVIGERLPKVRLSSQSRRGGPIVGDSMTEVEARDSVQWLADQIVKRLPRQIDGDDDWGNTRRTWAGVKWRRDGWKWSTKRRWRELRHGRWVKYQIQLPEPPPRQPRSADERAGQAAAPIQIDSARRVLREDGQDSWRINANLSTPAKFKIRIERWNLDVQWYSVQVTGTLQIDCEVTADMAARPDYTEVPPALQLDLKVSQAQLELRHLNVDRISKLGGDPAEELGELAEDTLIRLWLAKENQRLADRLNRTIERHRDDLRWSAGSLWQATEDTLPR